MMQSELSVNCNSQSSNGRLGTGQVKSDQRTVEASPVASFRPVPGTWFLEENWGSSHPPLKSTRSGEPGATFCVVMAELAVCQNHRYG